DSINSLALGSSHACATGPDGRTYCWGYNSWGQLGSAPAGDATANRPAQVMNLGRTNSTGVVQDSLGDFTSCARFADYTVWCWGKNNSYQFGSGQNDPGVPVGVLEEIALLNHVAQVVHSAGDLDFNGDIAEHACARLRDGTALCWGANSLG